MKKIPLYLIAALGRNREIGKNNRLIWHIGEDLKRFKKLTTGNTLIMGRKTFESIGKALPGRVNIVISSRPEQLDDAIWQVDSPEKALELAECIGKPVFIIGGASIYARFMPLATAIYLTMIDETDPEADTFFPDINISEWKKTEKSPWYTDTKTGIRYRFLLLKRKKFRED